MFGIFPAGHGVGHPYTPVLVYFIGVALMCAAFAFLPSFITARQRLKGKVAPYECGIDVEDSRIAQFDIRFYLVAMLFLVFDCEIVFLFPYGVTLKKVPVAGFVSVMSFLAVLIVGFIYEWKKKSLDW